MNKAGIRLRRTYRDYTMLLRVDRRVGSVRFGKVCPDSRTGTTCTTRRWESGRVRTGFGAHLHREPAHPGRRVVPWHHAPDRLARARLGPPRARRPIPSEGGTGGSIHTDPFPTKRGREVCGGAPAGRSRPRPTGAPRLRAPNQRSSGSPSRQALPKSSVRPEQSTGQKVFLNYPTRSSLPQVASGISHKDRLDGGVANWPTGGRKRSRRCSRCYSAGSAIAEATRRVMGNPPSGGYTGTDLLETGPTAAAAGLRAWPRDMQPTHEQLANHQTPRDPYQLGDGLHPCYRSRCDRLVVAWRLAFEGLALRFCRAVPICHRHGHVVTIWCPGLRQSTASAPLVGDAR